MLTMNEALPTPRITASGGPIQQKLANTLAPKAHWIALNCQSCLSIMPSPLSRPGRKLARGEYARGTAIHPHGHHSGGLFLRFGDVHGKFGSVRRPNGEFESARLSKHSAFAPGAGDA